MILETRFSARSYTSPFREFLGLGGNLFLRDLRPCRVIKSIVSIRIHRLFRVRWIRGLLTCLRRRVSVIIPRHPCLRFLLFPMLEPLCLNPKAARVMA